MMSIAEQHSVISDLEVSDRNIAAAKELSADHEFDLTDLNAGERI